MKHVQIIYLLLVLAITIENSQSQPYQPYDKNQTVIQEFVSGVFEQNNMTAPKQFAACIDPISAAKIAEAMPDYYEKLMDIKTAQYSLIKLYAAIDYNPNTVPCLNNIPEVVQFRKVVDSSNVSPVDFVKWATDNFDRIKQEAMKLMGYWTEGKFYQGGRTNVALIQTLIDYTNANKNLNKIPISPSSTSLEILQEILDGVFQDNKLPKPRTLLFCFDKKTMDTVIQAITPPSLSSLVTMYPLLDRFSPNTNNCLKTNLDFAALMKAYDVSNISNYQLGQWLNNNALTLYSSIQDISSLMAQFKYNDFGKELSKFIHGYIKDIKETDDIESSKAQNPNNDNIQSQQNASVQQNAQAQQSGQVQDNKELNNSSSTMAQSFFDGVFQQQGLPSPTFLKTCFPSPKDQNITAFLPRFLQLASVPFSINEAFNQLFQFFQSQLMNECVQNSSEIQSLLKNMGITTPATASTTLRSYIQGNQQTTAADFKDSSNQWNQSQFSKSGQIASSWFNKVFGSNSSTPANQPPQSK